MKRAVKAGHQSRDHGVGGTRRDGYLREAFEDAQTV
jgi:hypothetical protein